MFAYSYVGLINPTIVGNDKVGGLFGYLGAISDHSSGIVLSDLFFDSNISSLNGIGSSSSTSYAKTTSEMKQKFIFTNWDIVNSWDIVENTSYPFLR